MLEVKLIGKFEILFSGKSVRVPSRAAQSLFAYLILTAGTPHRREKLAGMFWPEVGEEKARTYLRHELWRLRKAISTKSKTEHLIADDIIICFNPSSEYSLDVTVLKEQMENSSIAELMDALSVYQGELLPGFYEDWVTGEREHLRKCFDEKIEYLLTLLEAEKRWKEILDWAERWIEYGAVSETAYRYLMMAYDALGDRAKVTATYQRCQQALREFHLEPSEQTRALAIKRTSKINVPIPLTSFIGREKELQEVTGLLSKSRLVTLTGSGGVGKTRIAIHVVADLLDRFEDGIWFLDLAPLSNPALVPNTLANLLGLRETAHPKIAITDVIKHYLHSRTALIIFDNCEHLLDACATLVESLLQSCNDLRILATSREVLRISGEIPYRVPSLEIPGQDIEFGLDVLSNIESVKLFVERATLASTGFKVDSRNVQAIAQICQRLDGIPLAIELASVRVNVLTVEQILKRLSQRFDLLTSGLRTALPRHKTLRATIEWSYNLLSDKEQLLFRRLAVFVGGWTLEAAEEVCSGDSFESKDILDSLSQLVNKSLVVVGTIDNKTRYNMLETIRQFAHEKLTGTAENIQLRDRQLAYFLGKAEEIEQDLIGVDQPELLNYLERELENIRLSLDWSISNNRGEEALRLFGALGWFWVIRSHFTDGIEWFRRAMQSRYTVSKRVQMKALRHVGSLYFNQEDFSSSRNVLKESLRLCRELGDSKEISTGLQFLGVLENGQGEFVKARRLLEESLIISRSINNQPAITRALLNLANISRKEGHYLASSQQLEEGLEICRQMQDSHLTALVLGSLGDLALIEENYPDAREYHKDALALCLKIKNKRTIGETLLAFAKIFYAEARYAKSAQLQGFTVTMLNEPGVFLVRTTLAKIEEIADLLKTCIGKDAYDREFYIGKTLRLEQAVEIALKQ